MNQEFKEKVSALRDAQSALADAEAKFTSIAKRLEGAESLIDGLQKKTAGKEAEKEKVLGQFALGLASQADMDRARKALDAAKKEEAEAEELVDAMGRVKSNLKLEIPSLRSRALSCEREVWRSIRDQEVERLKKLVGRALVRAFSAQAKIGQRDWWSFLKESFPGPDPEASEIQDFQTALTKEYGVNV